MTATRLAYDAYLDHITSESRRFRDVLARTDPDARVPTAPDWSASDLLGHLGHVQHFWYDVVATRPQPPSGEEPTPPSGFAERLDYFDEWSARFADLLRTTDPDEPAWNWSGTEQTVSFTFRRQAHEALIHRLDAEIAAGEVTPLHPLLALDGVDEVIDLMYGGAPEWATFTPLPRYVELRASDLGRSVWARLGHLDGTTPDGTTRTAEPDLRRAEDPRRPADATVTAPAADLDAWLWHRRGQDAVEVAGDPETLDHVGQILDQPIQ